MNEGGFSTAGTGVREAFELGRIFNSRGGVWEEFELGRVSTAGRRVREEFESGRIFNSRDRSLG